MKVSPARTSAFDVLLKIETEKSFSSILLPQYESQLSDVNRTLCHELTLGVLRRQIYLDRVIGKFAGAKKLDEAVRIALRLGLYQLLFLDRVPAYSAINESVELVGRARKKSAKGFVNAILRQASRSTLGLHFSEDIDRISVETSHPRWLIERWADEFGQTDAVSIAEANNRPAELAFRFTGKGISAGIQPGKNWSTSPVVNGCYTSRRATAELLALADSGKVYFQDKASQLVASAIKLSESDRFLDVCAAPGSKTTAVVARLATGSATVIAGDLHWSRVYNLNENARRQGIDWINIVQYDAENALPFAEAAFDWVLVDAPCSGTGTIRHNPELRYFLTPDVFPEFNSKQLAILKAASKMVKPGGRLVYSTCSLERQENEAVCNSFRESVRGFEKAAPNVPSKFLTEDGFARTLPHRDDMDGFFIAQFTRNAAGE
jgi:16S rRNA (cytosine967-C5)-methyltransferase